MIQLLLVDLGRLVVVPFENLYDISEEDVTDYLMECCKGQLAGPRLHRLTKQQTVVLLERREFRAKIGMLVIWCYFPAAVGAVPLEW